MFRKFLVRLIPLFLFVEVGLVVVFVFIQARYQQESFIKENKRLARVIATAIEMGQLKRPYPFATLKQITGTEDISFWWVVEPKGKIHWAYDTDQIGKMIDLSLFKTDPKGIKDIIYSGERVKFLAQPLYVGGSGGKWTLCLGISLKRLIAERNKLIIYGAGLIIIATCILIGITFFFTKRITRPVSQLLETTQLIAKGNYDRRVIMRTGDELEKLGDAFNEMAHRIKIGVKALQDFIYIASHDLREPIRKIYAFGKLLQESMSGRLTKDEKENFQFMTDGASRMQAMLDDLLVYSRVSARVKPLECVDLHKIIQDLRRLELAVQLEESKGVINIVEPLPPVQADPVQMHQLFQNLIGNALKFHKDNGPPEITVRGELVHDMVRVEVVDNGIGIPEKDYDKIFGMFQTLHKSYKGTGIGLAICKQIVERHRGEIGVISTLGEGSTFRFTLPKGKEET